MPKVSKPSALQRLGEYKMTVLERCLESDIITKLLAYDTKDALFRPSLTEEEREALLYKKLFPYRFVPDAIETQGTFLTLGARGFRKHQEGYDIYENFQAGEICFYFFTHVDLMRTNSGIRQDLLLAEMDKVFNHSKGIGMSTLQLRYMDELWIHNNKFGGYTLSLTMTDFS